MLQPTFLEVVVNHVVPKKCGGFADIHQGQVLTSVAGTGLPVCLTIDLSHDHAHNIDSPERCRYKAVQIRSQECLSNAKDLFGGHISFP